MTAPVAILGAPPAFPDGVPYVRPALPPLERLTARLAPSYDRGVITNGPLVRELEVAMAARLGTAHAVAVSSCTAGLMLALQSFGARGAVLMPSFTFAATAHAAVWNGLVPVFAECAPDSFQLDVGDAGGRLDGVDVVVANHVFGTPCRAEAVEELGARAGARVLFDSASALGARRGGRPTGGFGDVEVFSMSPSKPLIAAEGGIVATDDEAIAEHVRLGRDYGNPGDYDTRFVGLNARLSELHAALALESLDALDANLASARDHAARYQAVLDDLPGVQVQRVDDGDEPTWKDFGIRVDADAFGLDRDELAAALAREGIDTRRYFSPPVHRQQSYAGHGSEPLPVTDAVAGSVLTLPAFAALEPTTVDRIAATVATVHEHADAVRAELRRA